MKITVRINEFNRLLEESRQVTMDKASIRALSHVKVDVDSNNRANMSAGDSAMSIVQTFEVIDGEAGSFLLPAKQTSEFLRSHVGGTATIESTPDPANGRDDLTIIRAGAFIMTVQTPRVVLFPSLESMPETSHAISLKFLRNLITRVESACTRDTKSISAVVRIDSDGNRLHAAATDGNRIAIADVAGDWGVFTMLLPKHFLPLIKRRAGATVQFAESEAYYFFRTDTVSMQCRKSTKSFPNYRKFTDNIEPFFKGSVHVASADLKSAIINILSVLSAFDRKCGHAAYTIRGQSLLVSVNGSSMATGSVAVSAEGNSDITVRMNSHFILDFLAQVDGEVKIQFSDEDNPMKLSKGDNFHYIVMPLLSEAARRRMEQEAEQKAVNRKEEASRRTAEANPTP